MDQASNDGKNSRLLIHPEIRSLIEPFENSDQLLNEAEFGYRYIRRYLEDISDSGRILEIGSGPCILLSQIRLDFPDLDIRGVEPIGPGFDRFDDTLEEMIRKYGLDLVKAGYEDLDDSKRCDFIFLVNVFEHLVDWRHFLEFLDRKLKPSGKCLILCPNYSFPYESHFALPIIFNKGITHSVFRSRIARYESENDCTGLWDSLNFVKWTQVRKHLKESKLEAAFNPKMLREMIERLDDDPAFAQRQKGIALLARLMLKLGVVRLFEFSSFHRFHPYMHLEIRLRDDN